MKTLIELYDRRPLENVLSTLVFRPERTVFVCPTELANDKSARKKLEDYLQRKGVSTRIEFRGAGIYDTEGICRTLKDIASEYPDCALEIAGGTEAALFAAGLACAECGIPVFTYSRRRNMFFEINNAPFARELPCEIEFDVEDFFRMAGGSVRDGRYGKAELQDYMSLINPFFSVFLKFRQQWTPVIDYIQRISRADADGRFSLKVKGDYVTKGERGSRLTANEDALKELQRIGMISGLEINTGVSVSFRFKDSNVRSWLRDIGAVLELYIYKACMDAGVFHDVKTSVIADWDGDEGSDSVTNEIDVMAAAGVFPVFISCKTGEVKTEALNELSVLSSRFGGNMARAVIVTAKKGSAMMRSRASELGIQVIALDDLTRGTFKNTLKKLGSVENLIG